MSSQNCRNVSVGKCTKNEVDEINYNSSLELFFHLIGGVSNFRSLQKGDYS